MSFTTANDAIALTLQGREAAEALMTSRCRVVRFGEPVEDERGNTATPEIEAYVGPCKVQSSSAANLADEPTVGGHHFVIEGVQLHLPVSSKCQVDDEATITRSDLDPDLVGVKVRLREQPRGTYRTADRWSVDMVTR